LEKIISNLRYILMDSFEKTNRSGSKRSGSVKEEELRKLLAKSGKITSQDFLRLRSIYKDEELVNDIQNAYIEKTGNISKKAKKFAQLIREKYNDSQTPFHVLLDKALKYKAKYGLTDDEFAEFQRIYEQELVGLKSQEVILPATNVQKLLGGVTLDFHGFASKLDGDDYKYLQEILKLQAASRPLHAQVLLQSIKYRDLDFEAISGVYDRNLHRIGEHIHPVVVALFWPKFEVVENFFLFSNISNIVKARYNGEPLTSRPDYELFYALTTDPNDVVCDNKSTVLDLFNRAQLQTQLWNTVLHLRNGQYYSASFKEFLQSVDLCRLNRQDTPDFVYGRYDGVIIKRLLSAFSFRPTTVAVTPAMVNTVALNPYAFNVRPQITAIPMINMRIPPKLADSTPIELKTAMSQIQLFIEGGQIVPRSTQLIWSRGILIFYVDRRATSITLNNQLEMFSMNQLPAPIAGFEKLNDREVKFEKTMNLRSTSAKDSFNLRSIVFSEVSKNADGTVSNIVVGSSSLVCKLDAAGMEEGWVCYDPYAPLLNKSKAMGSTAPIVRDVVTWLEFDDAANKNSSVKHLGEKYGTIFIYGNTQDIYAKREDFF